MSFKASVSLLIFCLNNLSIDVSVMLKFPIIIVLLSISSFVYISFIYLGAPLLGAHIFTTVLSTCWIDSVIIMECPSLFLL